MEVTWNNYFLCVVNKHLFLFFCFNLCSISEMSYFILFLLNVIFWVCKHYMIPKWRFIRGHSEKFCCQPIPQLCTSSSFIFISICLSFKYKQLVYKYVCMNVCAFPFLILFCSFLFSHENIRLAFWKDHSLCRQKRLEIDILLEIGRHIKRPQCW